MMISRTTVKQVIEGMVREYVDAVERLTPDGV
jgi:hypothetical protein